MAAPARPRWFGMDKPRMLLMRAVGSVPLFAAAATPAVVAQTRPLTISGQPTRDELRSVLGNGWLIYLDGDIDADAGKRLSAFLATHQWQRRANLARCH